MDPIEEWHSDHAANLRNFLETPTGKLTIELLRTLRPAYALTTETNDIISQHRRQEGYEKTLDNLSLITSSEFLQAPKSDNNAYPSIDDDSKWGDNKPTQ